MLIANRNTCVCVCVCAVSSTAVLDENFFSNSSSQLLATAAVSLLFLLSSENQMNDVEGRSAGGVEVSWRFV